MKYAGFWRQLFAVIIDQTIIILPATLIPEAYFYIAVANGVDVLDARIISGNVLMVLMVAFFVFYYVFLNGRYGVTLGRRIMNIKLIRLDRPNGDGIGYGRATLRIILFALLSGFVRVSAIDIVPVILGIVIDALAGATVLWLLIDPRRRTLEDRLSGTALVYDPVGKFLDFDPDRLPSSVLRYASFTIIVVINTLASIFVALNR